MTSHFHSPRVIRRRLLLLVWWYNANKFLSDVPNPVNDDFLQVQLLVKIHGVVPAGGGQVDLVCLDMPNECIPGSTGDDNNDGLLKNLPSKLAFLPGELMQTVTVKVGQKAGDNYKVTATGGTIPNTEITEDQLTVWRRLWVELDQMEMPVENDPAHGFLTSNKGNGQGQWNYTAPTNEPDDFDVLFQPPKPDISVLTSAMVAACITVQEATPAIITSWGLTSRETTPFVHNTTNFNDHAVTIGNASRDVTVNNASFWCIQGVGAYEADTQWDWDWSPPVAREDPVQGVARPDHGIFLLFQEAIRDFAKSGWRPILPMEITLETSPSSTVTCKRNADEINQIATFHEVLHFFGFDDRRFSADEPGIRPVYDPETEGEIMTHNWFYTETVAPTVLTFTPGQIARIQSKPCPGNYF